jgi:squalene monooxygenase
VNKIYDLLFLLTGALGIIFPIIKGEGVGQMFFPFTMSAYYKTPPAKLS